MKKLSFKDYYDSKIKLLTESVTPIVFKTKHDVYKYCKVPFIVNDEKKYISFKPKDLLIVEWQRIGNNIIPIKFQLNETDLLFSWNDKKMKTWVETSTTQLFD